MEEREFNAILERFGKIEGDMPRLRKGVIVDNSPLSVAIAGNSSTYDNVKTTYAASLPIGADVLCLASQRDLVILGKIATTGGGGGGGTFDVEAIHIGDTAGGALDGTFPSPGLNSSVAGPGLSELANVLSANAGPGLEIVSDAIQIAASAAGTGLTGGGGSALAVSYGTTLGTATQGNDSRLSDSRTPNGAAGGALDGTFPSPGLAASVAGAGLAESSDVLSVNVDGSTLEINTDTLRVKALGITDAHVAAANKDGLAATPSMRTLGTGATQAAAGTDSRLSDSRAPAGSAGGSLDGTYPNPGLNASVAGSGLAEASDVLSVNVDNSTIEISTDTLRVKAGGIGTNEIATDGVGQAEIAAASVGKSELRVLGAGVGNAIEWGATEGGTADVNIYRLGADVLGTDDAFLAGADVASHIGAATQVVLGAVSGNAGILFGATEDPYLYQFATHHLRAYANFQVEGDLHINPDLGGNRIYFGPWYAPDADLYRGASGRLRTSSAFMADGNVGFNGQTPAARPTYLETNVITDRAYNANATSIDEVADVLGTLIADLRAIGLVS